MTTAQSYGADAERWLFLTGDREEIHRLCEQGFMLGVKPNDDPATAAAEPIAHSWRFVLVDRRGRIRGFYDGTDSREMELLRGDARTVLEEKSEP
jgi:cytochrome oxidase Cu insertion factor (SCO1/SenC/PrrC family)